MIIHKQGYLIYDEVDGMYLDKNNSWHTKNSLLKHEIALFETKTEAKQQLRGHLVVMRIEISVDAVEVNCE